MKFYETADGSTPFEECLEKKLDVVARNRVRERLTRVRLGSLGGAKAIADGVKELRLAFGPGYRVYFGEDGDDVVVLLVGGDKGSQAADIKKARRYWADYLSR